MKRKLEALLNCRVIRLKRPRAKPAPKKSRFVRFFESLQNRGPLAPNSLHEKWTKKVRADMEVENSWPTGLDEVSLPFVAEYMSRLQKEFWDEYPKQSWESTDLWAAYDKEPEFMLLKLRAFMIAYRKIRIWGLRTKTFELSLWTGVDFSWGRTSYACVVLYRNPSDGPKYAISPYTKSSRN